MKKTILTLCTASLMLGAAATTPRAIYVKNSDGVTKYAFRVAGNLKFSEDGKTLHVDGYDSRIDLSDVEYITFKLPTDGQLTPSEQKDKLINVGETMNSKIDVNDLRDAIEMGCRLDDYEYYDTDVFFEAFKKAHPDLFDEGEDDYCDPCYQTIRKVVRAMSDLAKGDLSAVRRVTTYYTETFRKSDITGVFTPNPAEKAWEKVKDADYLEIYFTGDNGKKYDLKVTFSDTLTEWHEKVTVKDDYYDYKSDYDGTVDTYEVDMTGQLPTLITGTLSIDGETLAEAIIQSNLNQDNKSLDLNTTVTYGNKYKVTDSLQIRNYIVTDHVTFHVNNELLVDHHATVNGRHLLEVQEWADDIQGIEETYEWEGYYDVWYDPDGQKISQKFDKARTYTDVMGMLQVEGHASNFGTIYDRMDKYEEENDFYSREINKDKGTITYVYGTESSVTKEAELLNTYTDASFYYDGNGKLQGFLTFQPYCDEDEWTYTSYYDEETGEPLDTPVEYTYRNTEYSVMPYLTFSDGTSFAFDSDYFTGGNFQKLVNDYESIVDTFESIVDDYTEVYERIE